jgi:hypothetical protein
MTPSLLELQRAFAAGVLEDGTGVLAHLRPLAFEPARHLQVYRNNTFANLTDALAAIYPVVKRLVGDGFFSYLADSYIRANPPHSGNLHDFGSILASFVAGFEPARSLTYLADVARLEWAWHAAFHAADRALLDPLRIASIAPEHYSQLRFCLHPSAQLLESRFPILRIWEANQDEAEDASVDLDSGEDRLLVIRRRLDVLIERLSPGDYQLLAGCQKGLGFERACEQALACEPDFDLPAALRWHIARGTFTDIHSRPG